MTQLTRPEYLLSIHARRWRASHIARSETEWRYRSLGDYIASTPSVDPVVSTLLVA
jgi:hypothetical protein